jgi:ribosome-binding factor A
MNSKQLSKDIIQARAFLSSANFLQKEGKYQDLQRAKEFLEAALVTVKVCLVDMNEIEKGVA